MAKVKDGAQAAGEGSSTIPDGLALGLRLLMPLPVASLQQRLAGARQVWVVEHNHSAQLYRHLRAHLEGPLRSFAHPGPLPIRPAQLHAALEETP